MSVEERDFSELENDEVEPSTPRRLPGLTRWLIALGMLLVFLTLFLVSQTIQETTIPLATEVEVLRTTLTAVPQPLPAREEINSAMLRFASNAAVLSGLTGTLTAQHITWPEVINRLADYDGSQVYLTGIAQQPTGQIVVSGQAINESVVINYTDRLRQSDQFTSVVVQSITLKSNLDNRGAPKGDSAFPGRDQYSDFVFSVTLSGNGPS